MTIRDLEIFMEVVKYQNMSLAARALNISQPTVSHAISQIESEYEIVLFERASKRLHLTDTGYRLYHKTQKLLKDFRDLDVEFKNNQNHITLGIHDGIPTQIVINFSKMMKEKHNIDIMFVRTDEGIMLEQLKQGELDAVILDDTNNLKYCNSSPGFKLTYLLATSKENVGDFPNDLKFIYWAGTDENTVLDKLAMKYPVDMKYKCSSIDSALKLMDTEKVYTFLPLYTINESEQFEVVSDLSFRKKFRLFYRQDKYVTREMSILIDEVYSPNYDED